MEKIKAFLNRQAAGFYIGLLAALLAALSCILYVSNSTYTYFTDFNTSYFLAILSAFILIAAVLILPQFIGNNKLLIIAFGLAVVLIGLYAFYFINERAETLAIVFFSDLESHNQYAQFGARQTVTTFVAYLLTLLLTVITSFFKVIKD